MKMRGSTLIIKANVITKDNQRQLRQFGNKKKKTEKEENICICKVVITTKVASSD